MLPLNFCTQRELFIKSTLHAPYLPCPYNHTSLSTLSLNVFVLLPPLDSQLPSPDMSVSTSVGGRLKS